MVTEIRVYVEGGGECRGQQSPLREGFSQFFDGLVSEARARQVRWSLIACGSRGEAYRDFTIALRQHPDAFNVLLVDSEGPVNGGPCRHLESRDKWPLSGIADERCHLMVQMMEAWFVADAEALKKFYGDGFNANALPKNPNVEEIDKKDLEKALKQATDKTTKGEYAKIRHAAKLLGLLNVDRVRRASVHCARLFSVLSAKIAEPA